MSEGIARICMVSCGEASAFTAEIVRRKYGTAGMMLLFADTLAEDSDAYRFLIETACHILSVPLPSGLTYLLKTLPEWHKDRFGRRAILAEIFD